MKKLIILLIISNISMMAFGQQYWNNMVAPTKVNDILETSSTLWMATNGGVIAVDKSTNAVTQFTKEDGLPSNWVEGIDMDNAGNLWIGTYTMNLAKYDGTSWTHITYPDTFPDLKTHCIRVDGQGVVWAGTSDGIMRYDGTDWKLFSRLNTNISTFDEVWELEIDNQGNIYGASFDMVKYDGANWTNLTGGTDIFSYGASHLDILDNGQLMYSNMFNLVCFYDTAWTIYSSIDGDFPHGQTLAIGEDGNGDVYITMEDSGLYKLTNGTWQKEILPTSQINEAGISTLYNDNQDNFWIGNSFNFAKIDGGNTQSININPTPIASNLIKEVIHHHQDIYIINGKSLSRFTPSTGWSDIPLPTATPNLVNAHLRNMVVTDNGEYWISTSFDALLHWNGQIWTTFSSVNSALPNQVRDMAWDEQNDILWLATTGGVVKVDGQQWTVYNSTNTIFADDYMTKIEARDGKTYVASGFIIYEFDGTNWADISPNSTNYVYSLYLDRSDNLWIGTWGSGVFKYDGTTWDSIPMIEHHTISAIVEAANGNFYFGTYYEGLIRFDGTTWTYFTEGNSGLHDKSVYALTTDIHHQLWVSSTKGISIYHPGGIVSDEAIPTLETSDFKVFPNPITAQATIEFTLKNSQNVRLGVYDVTGRLVHSILNNSSQPSGRIAFDFEKSELTSGIYFVKLELENRVETIKILVR